MQKKYERKSLIMLLWILSFLGFLDLGPIWSKSYNILVPETYWPLRHFDHWEILVPRMGKLPLKILASIERCLEKG